jgi:hypothetical protein
MAQINVQGTPVTVDDSFLALSPAVQASTVDSITRALKAPAPPAAAPSTPNARPYWADAPLDPSAPFWAGAPLADYVAARAAPAQAPPKPGYFDDLMPPAPGAQTPPKAGYFDDLMPPARTAPTLTPVDHDPFAAPAAPAQAPSRTFNITDQSGATYQVGAPDENAAMSALRALKAGAPSARTPTLTPVDYDPFAPQAPSWITRAMASIVAPVAGSLLGANSKTNPGVPTVEGTANDIARNVANGASLGFADKLAAGGDAMLGSGDYATNLAAQRAQSQAAMARQGVAGNAEQIAGMLAPAGAIGKAAAGLGALADGVPLVGRVLGNPFVQAAATGAGVGAGDAAGHDTDLLRGALTGAASGVVGKGLADARPFRLARSRASSTLRRSSRARPISQLRKRPPMPLRTRRASSLRLRRRSASQATSAP